MTNTWSTPAPVNGTPEKKSFALYKPMTQGEVNELHSKFMNGDKEVGFLLAASVLPLIVSLAKRYYKKYLDRIQIEDFCQEILLHLVQRLHLYDKDKGMITTWAGWELRHYAADKLIRYISIVKVPACARSKGVEPLEFTDHSFYTLQGRDLDPINGAILNEFYENVINVKRELINLSPKSNRKVLKARFIDQLSYAEIGRTKGVSRQAVEQMCKTAIRRLRNYLGPDADENVIKAATIISRKQQNET